MDMLNRNIDKAAQHLTDLNGFKEVAKSGDSRVLVKGENQILLYDDGRWSHQIKHADGGIIILEAGNVMGVIGIGRMIAHINDVKITSS